MKSLPTAILMFAVTLALLAAGQAQAEPQRIYIDSTSYAAIAYSPTSGEIHIAYGYGSQAAAERAALGRCSARDAEIVVWVTGGFCALAIGEDGTYDTGWSAGDGCSYDAAVEEALRSFRKDGVRARIAVVLTSDGQGIWKW